MNDHITGMQELTESDKINIAGGGGYLEWSLGCIIGAAFAAGCVASAPLLVGAAAAGIAAVAIDAFVP